MCPPSLSVSGGQQEQKRTYAGFQNESPTNVPIAKEIDGKGHLRRASGNVPRRIPSGDVGGRGAAKQIIVGYQFLPWRAAT
jgi:hypothetical protein